MKLILRHGLAAERKVLAGNVLGRVEQLLSKFLPDEESSDSQNEAYEFMLQTMGWRVATAIGSLGQDKRAGVFQRLRKINPEAEGCTPTQSRLWSCIMDEFEILHGAKSTR